MSESSLLTICVTMIHISRIYIEKKNFTIIFQICLPFINFKRTYTINNANNVPISISSLDIILKTINKSNNNN